MSPEERKATEDAVTEAAVLATIIIEVLENSTSDNFVKFYACFLAVASIHETYRNPDLTQDDAREKLVKGLDAALRRVNKTAITLRS